MTEMFAMNGHKTAPKLGEAVEYRDSNGFRKAAIVTATAESVDPAGPLEAPGDGRVHLAVLSPSGHLYPAFDIPPGDGPHTYKS